MRTEITSKKYDTNQFVIAVFEHIMLSAVTFTASFIGLFYILGDSGAEEELMYLLENGTTWYLLCGIITIIANIITIFRKGNKKSIYKLIFIDDVEQLILETRKRYSNKKTEESIPYRNLRHEITYKEDSDKQKFPTINIYNETSFVGDVFLYDIIWDKDKRAYKTIAEKLKKIAEKQQVQV